MTDEEYMRLAIDKSMNGILKGQLPFGACIVKNRNVVCCAHNTNIREGLTTEHAEMNAINMACHKLGTVNLSGCTIYCTCEPCPMCFGACHLARISRIVFGATLEDGDKAGLGVLDITNVKMNEIGKGAIEIREQLLRDECLELFLKWQKISGRK